MKKTLLIIAALLLISVSISACDAAKEILDKKTDNAEVNILVSLSDDNPFAQAVVIIEKI